MPGPLDGITVLDLGRFVAAPWCAQILADLGAEVIKIEQPGQGDQIRQYGPPFLAGHGKEHGLTSSYFAVCNRGKKSVIIDLADPEGQSSLKALAAQADVFIENFKAGHLKRFGLDEASIRAVAPDIIYLSISGFGQTGPYSDRPGLDSVFQAMGGLMSVTGEPDSSPTKIGVTIVDLVTGLYGAIAVLGALRDRDVNGVGGQAIDLALLDTAIAMMSHRAQDYLLTGEVPRASGTATVGSTPAQVFRAGDGWINIQAGSDDGFERFCRAIRREDLWEDSRFRHRLDRWANRELLLPELDREVGTRAVRELYDLLTKAGVVCSPIYTLDQTFSDPQVVHRGVTHTVEHPLAGPFKVVRNPIRYSKSKLLDDRPPPVLGADTDEMLSRLKK
jgi:crotonobetainyl-CoA:carnitine CoA-transferase CaiB-like acyl-CoA transferase